jgi:glycolate oxidase FAD binding subunit
MRCRRDPMGDDAVSGVAPRVVFEPRSREECAEVFAFARTERLALAVVGGRTEVGLGPPPARLDAVVSSRGLDRVLEYAPSDQVVVVEAGVTLASLQAVLAPHGQRLACDPPHPDAATLGGILATNAFGPLRSRYGSLRDLLIGVSILRADATTVRGGGKVVKNVAGFDLPKLAVGSLGSLGMIATAAFRVHPMPEAVATLRFRRMTPRAVRLLATAVRDAQVEPAAFVGIGTGETFDVLLRIEGFAAGVAEQRTRAATLDGPSAEVLSPDEGQRAWLEHDAARDHGNACVKISTLPTSLETLASEVLPRLKAVMASATTVLHPTLGLSFVGGDTRDTVDFAAALASARARLGRGPAMRGAIDMWGHLPGAFSTMKRLKEGFDPEGRMNSGRFVGGL